MIGKHTLFQGIQPFEVKAHYLDLDSKSTVNEFNSHIHNECEIYINLSGDVSFVVENSIYPIIPGSIIITRPFEYHHCVYHSNKNHKHFWILFSALGNEYLFDDFFGRKAGERNLLMLKPDKNKELLASCRKLTNESESEFEKYFNFFKIIDLLHDAAHNNADMPNYPDISFPEILINAMTYINHHLADALTVTEISQKVNVSVNTLERYFMRFLNISPTEFIRKKRLSNAAKLLSEGLNVTEAAEKSGFSNCSMFIAAFKKIYGQTPLTYKNQILKMSKK